MNNRREFISLLGGAAAAAWPLAVRAQQPAMPVIGFLSSVSPGPWAHLVAAFRQGLSETGYVEGRNVVIEFRWAEGRYDRLPALAADLVTRQVAVLVSTGGTMTTLAAKAATTKIPIVFTIGGDPVQLGIVASLNRPGGNITGVNIFTSEMGAKRLGLLHEMVPTAVLIAVLINPKNPNAETQSKDIPEAARSVAQRRRASGFGIGAPKNTPADNVDKLNREINAGLADPKIKARLADLGGEVLALSPADFAKLIAEETEKWGKVIRAANIKPD
jgi:putative tryptophan/tyrosine transport system substrate-binding protein